MAAFARASGGRDPGAIMNAVVDALVHGFDTAGGEILRGDRDASGTVARTVAGGEAFALRAWRDRPFDDNERAALSILIALAATEIREREAAEELRRQHVDATEVQERERRRIALELHDDLGQRLTALQIELAHARELLRTRGPAATDEVLAAAESRVRVTTQAVRDLAMRLRPAILDDFGLRAALDYELSLLRMRAGLECHLTFAARESALDASATTALYRIVQEALTNVVRHAQATRVDVIVAVESGSVVAEIRDDGRGIDAAAPQTKRTLGISGMRARAVAFGGDVRVERDRAGGTRVTARLPLAASRTVAR